MLPDELEEMKKTHDYEFASCKAEWEKGYPIWPMWLCGLFSHPWEDIGMDRGDTLNTYFRVCPRCGRLEVWKFKNKVKGI